MEVGTTANTRSNCLNPLGISLALIERKRVLDNECARRVQDHDDEQGPDGGGAPPYGRNRDS
jgi:hypothetical protein